MTRVLFVCLGNICRSPAAENIFRDLVEAAGRSGEFEIDSAGTMGWHTGKPPDERMQAALSDRGFSHRGSARQVDAYDFERFDLILAMDRSNLADLKAIRPPGDDAELAAVKLFCDYVQEFAEEEVPDPYEGGMVGFFHVIDLLVDGSENLLGSPFLGRDAPAP